MGWRIKRFFKKLMPWLLIGTVAFGGYHFYQQSQGRGRTSSLTRMLYQIPYFGSRFRHYNRSKSHAYRHGRKAYRKGKRGVVRRKKYGRKARRRGRRR